MKNEFGRNTWGRKGVVSFESFLLLGREARILDLGDDLIANPVCDDFLTRSDEPHDSSTDEESPKRHEAQASD